MSAYENVVGGKLKLKGKALDVKAGGIKKKKKKHKRHSEELGNLGTDAPSGESSRLETDPGTEDPLVEAEKSGDEEVRQSGQDDLLTPAERRYIEQKEKIDQHMMAKTANKSHRDRIQDFNQYLANMSEHYDIPKVGPG